MQQTVVFVRHLISDVPHWEVEDSTHWTSPSQHAKYSPFWHPYIGRQPSLEQDCAAVSGAWSKKCNIVNIMMAGPHTISVGKVWGTGFVGSRRGRLIRVLLSDGSGTV